jgi:gluconolactonase
MTLDIWDKRLTNLISPDESAVRLAAGFAFTEGPLWAEGTLFFSDIPNDRIARLSLQAEGPEVTTYSLGNCNGLAWSSDGAVLVAEHGGRRISRVSISGKRETLMDRFEGGRLNSPNDITTARDGAIYFTDPPYAVYHDRSLQEVPDWWAQPIPGKEQPFNGVYRLSADGVATLLIRDMALPNGLALSPDESHLYVADSHHSHIRSFRINDDGSVSDEGLVLQFTSEESRHCRWLDGGRGWSYFCNRPGGCLGVYSKR